MLPFTTAVQVEQVKMLFSNDFLSVQFMRSLLTAIVSIWYLIVPAPNRAWNDRV